VPINAASAANIGRRTEKQSKTDKYGISRESSCQVSYGHKGSHVEARPAVRMGVWMAFAYLLR
jgi:hypothetical protein